MKQMLFSHAAIAEDPEYNSYGHRCKEVADLDKDNYVLFAGCSHVVGVGVKIEESFPYLIAKELGCDYYNLGVGGGGLDALEHNLLLWGALIPNPPKYIFCEWPPEQRFMNQLPGYDNMLPCGSWHGGKNQEFLIEAYYPLKVKQQLVYQLVREVIDVPIIDIRYGPLAIMGRNAYTIWHQKSDVGTDGKHPGPLSHQETTNKVMEYLNTR